jgi:hypothetical protein
MTDTSPSPRRRRRRARRSAAEPADTAGAPDSPGQPARADSAPASGAKPRRRGSGRAVDNSAAKDSDRGWRELLGNAPSQVGVSGALRARDVARPRPEELAEVEQNLAIVRRQWKPPEEIGS